MVVRNAKINKNHCVKNGLEVSKQILRVAERQKIKVCKKKNRAKERI
jgi:glutamate mutase epsilon subunit